MKINSSNMLFLTFMLIGIEINFISFLPIMMNSMSVYSSESMVKYFIIQGMGSSLLFFIYINICL